MTGAGMDAGSAFFVFPIDAVADNMANRNVELCAQSGKIRIGNVAIRRLKLVYRSGKTFWMRVIRGIILFAFRSVLGRERFYAASYI